MDPINYQVISRAVPGQYLYLWRKREKVTRSVCVCYPLKIASLTVSKNTKICFFLKINLKSQQSCPDWIA